MATKTTMPTESVRKYLVVKFIGNLSNQVGLRYVPSKWLNSSLDTVVFIRYPSPDENQRASRLITNNLPALNHWKTYLARLYYQTDDIRDAMLFASHYITPERKGQSACASSSTSTRNGVVDASFPNRPAISKKLTLVEQFNIIQPLVASILRSINLFRDKYDSHWQASDNSDYYNHFQARFATYAKFLYSKTKYYVNLFHRNPKGIDVANMKIRDEMEKAMLQLLFIIEGNSELALAR